MIRICVRDSPPSAFSQPLYGLSQFECPVKDELHKDAAA